MDWSYLGGDQGVVVGSGVEVGSGVTTEAPGHYDITTASLYSRNIV